MTSRWICRISACCFFFALLVFGHPSYGYEMYWNEVHETITKEALKQVRREVFESNGSPNEYMNSKQFGVFENAVGGDKGVRYPDMPEGAEVSGGHFLNIKGRFSDFKNGEISQERWNVLRMSDLTARSHFGDRQHWHAMSNDLDSAVETRSKIIDQLSKWAEIAFTAIDAKNYRRAGQYWGRLLHTVQDSYSITHTKRENKYISEFYDYADQPEGFHEKGDRLFGVSLNNESYVDLSCSLGGVPEAMKKTRILTEAFVRGQRGIVASVIAFTFKLVDKPDDPCESAPGFKGGGPSEVVKKLYRLIGQGEIDEAKSLFVLIEPKPYVGYDKDDPSIWWPFVHFELVGRQIAIEGGVHCIKFIEESYSYVTVPSIYVLSDFSKKEWGERIKSSCVTSRVILPSGRSQCISWYLLEQDDGVWKIKGVCTYVEAELCD